jgi:hypothetical protein
MLTVDWIELVWMAVALPGLIVWAGNVVRSRRNADAVRKLQVRNGRLTAAVHLLRVAWVFVAIESFFVAIGVTSMLRIADPREDEPIRLFIAGSVIACSAGITWMGFERRRVEAELLRLRDMQKDLRETGQNTRETGQNTRESRQNEREVAQNTRDERGERQP